MTRLTGQASLSSVYGGAFAGGLTLSQYLARWNDGIVNFNTPLGLHTGTSAAAGDFTNPFMQVDLGAAVITTGINRIVLYNRNGGNACRLFSQNTGCGAVQSQPTTTWNGPNQGAIMGVSNAPLTTAMTTFYPNQCTNPGDTNCRCGMLSQYNASNGGAGPYSLSCNGAIGRYVWVSSCPRRPAFSFCFYACWFISPPSLSLSLVWAPSPFHFLPPLSARARATTTVLT
jgi:hypothetical protein